MEEERVEGKGEGETCCRREGTAGVRELRGGGWKAWKGMGRDGREKHAEEGRDHQGR